MRETRAEPGVPPDDLLYLFAEDILSRAAMTCRHLDQVLLHHQSAHL